MEDIKSLYLTAKASGNKNDIAAYRECVQQILENNPNNFLLHLEYIITSDIGLTMLDAFVEKYGLSVAAYDNIVEYLESCAEKCKKKKIDSSLYEEYIEKFEYFKEQYNTCFEMFDYFKESLPNAYVNTYYEFNKHGIQNSKLIKGMVDTFGEAAIPDIIITADRMGASALNQSLQFLEGYNSNPSYYTWIVEACKGCKEKDDDKVKKCLTEITNFSLESIVSNMRARNQATFREATIMQNDQAVYTYTEYELAAIKDLIDFYEYKMVCTENTTDAIALQNEIYSLYEEYDGLINEDGTFVEVVTDSVIPMLPSNQPMQEAQWLINTRNKKTGAAPGYLSRNHDIGYGEDDNDNKPKVDNNDDSTDTTPEKDHTLDDYKRPSANSTNDGNIPEDEDNSEENNNKKKDSGLSDDDKRAINNYYYYTYNNSLNKNANSFNKSSNTDDHSVNKGNGPRTNDDHSVNKGNNRDNSKTYSHEAANLLTLDIPLANSVITEAEAEAVASVRRDGRPESDHPIRDTLMDLDATMMKGQQATKKAIQDAKNVGRAFVKPFKRTAQWLNKMVIDWKDADENKVKERLADPHARRNLFTAIGTAIKGGSLLKAGVLLNPVFLFLTITRGIGKNKREYRIRNEMVGELKTEIAIIEEKKKDADAAGDRKAKYQLMRLENEINKKLIRVGGTKDMKKIL